MGMTALLWLTRDLRLHDHPALHAALDRHERAVPVFCLDDRLLRGRHASGPRTQFLLDCLADLDGSLRSRGSGLVVRHGAPERELPALAAKLGAEAVHCSADSGPFARGRMKRVVRALREVELVAHPGLHAVDDLGVVRTQSGKPYTVFSPFHRNWRQVARRDVLDVPRALPPLPSTLEEGRLPALSDLGLTQELEQPPRGGEAAGRERLSAFLADDVRDYADNHDALGRDRSSRLSPYLHFGCVSVREIERRLPRGAGPEAFRRQLCWRDFYAHVLLHHPRNARSEFQQRYRGEIRWSRAKRPFAAWCEGQTGFPLVDAGMRQLRREGWMHNRARLVVGSFLTKDLGIDWRWGERWFMRLLVDGDEANIGGSRPLHPAWPEHPRSTLAVDRLRGGGPSAGLPPHLQPGSPAGDVRSARRVCAPLRARAERRAGPLPGRAVDDAGGGPGAGRLQDRQRLPRADRRPRRRPPRGARALPRLRRASNRFRPRLKEARGLVDGGRMSTDVSNGIPEVVAEHEIVLDLTLAEAEAVKNWLLKPSADGSAAIDDEHAKSVMVKLGAKLDFIQGVSKVREELEQAGLPTDQMSDEQVADLGRRIAESGLRRFSGAQ